MNIRFNPKDVIVVTGGSRGIGNNIVTSLLNAGATTVVLSRDANNLQMKNLRSNYSNRLFMYNCDVSNYNEVQSVFNKIDCEIGNIYGLINNAGINPSRNSITKTSIGDWNKTIAVNLSGAFHCTQFALKSMEKGENGGVIIMISSIAGINTMEKRASYSASKAGLIGLMRSVAADYSDKNIRCFCICPGYIGTDLTKPYLDKLNSEDYINLLEKHKLGRIGVPSDIANMSLFLLSEYSNWMTGLVLPVDGGYSV